MLSHFSCVRLCERLWTVACQVPLSTGFSRKEDWSGLPFPSPGDLPNPGIEPMSLMSPALAGGFFTGSTAWEAPKKPPVCWLSIISLCQPSFGSLHCCPNLKTTLSVDKLSSCAACCTPGSMNLSRGISPGTKKTWGLKTAAHLAQPVLGEERVPSSGLCVELLWIGVRAQPRTKQPACCPPAKDLEAALGLVCFPPRVKKQRKTSRRSVVRVAPTVLWQPSYLGRFTRELTPGPVMAAR